MEEVAPSRGTATERGPDRRLKGEEAEPIQGAPRTQRQQDRGVAPPAQRPCQDGNRANAHKDDADADTGKLHSAHALQYTEPADAIISGAGKLRDRLGRIGTTLDRMDVCPTDVISAPAERIWSLMTDTRELVQWSGTRLVEGPAGVLSPGDHLLLRAGIFHVTFDVLDMEAPSRLTLDIRLPVRIRNHERIAVAPIDATSCRVTFN